MLQPARRRRAEMRQHRHQFAGARMAVHHAVRLAVHAAVNGVDESVAFSAAGILEKCCCENAFAGVCEHNVHRVVHPSGHHRLVPSTDRVAPKNMRRPRDPLATPERRVALLGKRPLAPVNPPVTPKVRPVQVVGTAGERFALEPLLALVGHAVAVGVRQPPDARRRGDVKRPVVPQRALGKHHPLGKHNGMIELAVTVAILQADDTMRLFRELFLDRIIRSRRVGDVQPALFIERGRDGAIDQRGPRDALHREAVRHGKDRFAQRHFDR